MLQVTRSRKRSNYKNIFSFLFLILRNQWTKNCHRVATISFPVCFNRFISEQRVTVAKDLDYYGLHNEYIILILSIVSQLCVFSTSLTRSQSFSRVHYTILPTFNKCCDKMCANSMRKYFPFRTWLCVCQYRISTAEKYEYSDVGEHFFLIQI